MSDLLKIKVGNNNYLCKFKYNDPRVLMLWYGPSENVQEPTGGISNPTIEYDTNGPLDVTGTGWSGTPCIAKNNLGGQLTGPWLVDGKGLQWTQPSIINQLAQNKPFTVEFWLRNDYPTTTSNFGDGGFPVSFITKQDFQMSGTDLIPNPSLGGWYGFEYFKKIYNTRGFNGNAASNTQQPFAGQAMKWVHLALTNDGSGNKSGLRYFANGVEMLYGRAFPQSGTGTWGESFDNNQYPWLLKNVQALMIGNVGSTNACNWRIAQLAVFNYCKYTSNFTPQRKPYFMGID